VAGIRERAWREPLWRVMEWAARDCNLVVDVRRGGIASSGPQLVIGNDPSPLMGFIILSVMRRDDVFFFGGPGWLKMGGSVSDHCLAVFNVGDLRKYPKEWLRAQLVFRFRDGMKPSVARERNRRSIERAADLVTSGATVYISPAGGTMGRADNWRHGVGSLAKRIGDVPAQVVMCRADDTTPRDFARMLNPYWFAAMRRPQVIPVQFSDPIPLSEFREPGMGSMDVSLRIRDRYLNLYGAL
jgi:hypothetical protein